MGLYDDIRDGLKRALILNEKVGSLDHSVGGLAKDVMRLADHVHEIDKRLVRIETLADLPRQGRLESKD